MSDYEDLGCTRGAEQFAYIVSLELDHEPSRVIAVYSSSVEANRHVASANDKNVSMQVEEILPMFVEGRHE